MNNQSFIVRGIGLYTDANSIANTEITSSSGIPIRVKDVATVSIQPAIKIGQVGLNYQDDAIEGIVLMRKGENPTKAIAALKNHLSTIEKKLPKGIYIKPIYEREHLINETLHTIGHNIALGIIFVVIILYAYILNLRVTLIASLVIPLAICFAFMMFSVFHISANLLSLGAVDFGILVDCSIILLENIFRYFTEYKMPLTSKKKNALVYKATLEVGGVITFSTFIIFCCFLPLFAFDGVAGKLFHPLAFTMGFSLLGAVLASLLLLTGLSSLWMANGKIVENKNKIFILLKLWYRVKLRKILNRPFNLLVSFFALFILSIFIFLNMGSEFLPNLDEGNIWLRVTILPRNTTISHSVEVARQVRGKLLERS